MKMKIKWSEFVKIHAPPVYQTAWRILGQVQDSEDVVQEVFIEAHARFMADDVIHWVTFLHRLTTYRAIDSLRQRRNSDSFEADRIADDQPTSHQQVCADELETQIRAIVAALPERQATVFCLVHFESKSVAEVARLLDITVNAVSIALHKARQTLKQRLFSRTEGPSI